MNSACSVYTVAWAGQIRPTGQCDAPHAGPACILHELREPAPLPKRPRREWKSIRDLYLKAALALRMLERRKAQSWTCQIFVSQLARAEVDQNTGARRLVGIWRLIFSQQHSQSFTDIQFHPGREGTPTCSQLWSSPTSNVVSFLPRLPFFSVPYHLSPFLRAHGAISLLTPQIKNQQQWLYRPESRLFLIYESRHADPAIGSDRNHVGTMIPSTWTLRQVNRHSDTAALSPT